MDNISAAAPETVSELPAEDQASTTGLKCAVMSIERLEIVASTLRVRANMKQCGYMAIICLVSLRVVVLDRAQTNLLLILPNL